MREAIEGLLAAQRCGMLSPEPEQGNRACSEDSESLADPGSAASDSFGFSPRGWPRTGHQIAGSSLLGRICEERPWIHSELDREDP
jgi:hypothetical protein